MDTENTGAQRNKAHPFDPRNRMCLLQWLDGTSNEATAKDIEYQSNRFFDEHLSECQEALDSVEWLVGFNLKYDLHWLQRYGINFKNKKVWDCQLVHFCITRQGSRYPSLNEVAEYWGLPTKLDVVASEYWELGLDTDEVPFDILEEYGKHDVWLTREIFRKQIDVIRNLTKTNKELYTTIRIALEDLLVIQKMEWYGIFFNKEKSIADGEALQQRVLSLYDNLREAADIPDWLQINWGSNQQISAVLYGGNIKYTTIEEYEFAYKDPKKGVVTKQRKVSKEHELPRLVSPLRGSEMAKEGIYAVDEGTLRKLRGSKKVKHIIELLLELAKIEKLISTYYLGFPARFDKMGWTNTIHSSLNQCVAVTRRLSSGNPNLQNIPPVFKDCFISRFTS